MKRSPRSLSKLDLPYRLQGLWFGIRRGTLRGNTRLVRTHIGPNSSSNSKLISTLESEAIIINQTSSRFNGLKVNNNKPRKTNSPVGPKINMSLPARIRALVMPLLPLPALALALAVVSGAIPTGRINGKSK